jgi:hypothetical protein
MRLKWKIYRILSRIPPSYTRKGLRLRLVGIAIITLIPIVAAFFLTTFQLFLSYTLFLFICLFADAVTAVYLFRNGSFWRGVLIIETLLLLADIAIGITVFDESVQSSIASFIIFSLVTRMHGLYVCRIFMKNRDRIKAWVMLYRQHNSR